MDHKRIFITGGAGFIGSNLANYFLGQGFPVSIYDNLSRKGVAHNLNGLRQNHGDRLAFIEGDTRDFAALQKGVAGAQVIYHTAGQIYNIGGSPDNTISVWAEFAGCLEELLGQRVEAAGFQDWRPGDQKIYVSNIRKAGRDFGWRPSVGVNEGLRRITKWVNENQELF